MLHENDKYKCPRCGSSKLDELKNKSGNSKNDAMHGNCDFECRECSCKFTKQEAKQV